MQIKYVSRSDRPQTFQWLGQFELSDFSSDYSINAGQRTLARHDSYNIDSFISLLHARRVLFHSIFDA